MIRSTFAGFTTAQLALAASQRALDVTGQNIANINTPGFTRQRLDISSLNTRGGEFYNSSNSIKVGYGVQMTRVEQLRDPFLDMQYRSQMANLGTTDAHVAGLEQLAPIFDEATMDGVRAALRDITSSLDKLTTQIGNQEFDTMVRSNMQILLNLFHDNSSRLQDVRNDAMQGFEKTDIADVNQLLENIANLNTSIKNSEILGNPALELKDQRNELLDQLSGYLPISVKYSDKEIAPGQYVEILDVNFTDTEGNSFKLISDADYGYFTPDISGQPVKLSLQDALGGKMQEISNTIGSGSLKGTLDFLNKEGDFNNSDFKGLGYYEKALDSLVNTFATEFNRLNNLGDPNGAKPLFTTLDGKTEGFTASNIKIADDWTRGEYGITPTKYQNPEDHTTAHDNILEMIKLLDTPLEFKAPGKNGDITFFKGSFYSCYANIESTLGIDTRSNNTTLENRLAVLKQTSNAKDGVSGVQLDEEGMNLMHYQQSYTAAARFMTTLDEALDKLINGTGVVGR